MLETKEGQNKHDFWKRGRERETERKRENSLETVKQKNQ
jgi:hypothetical protein